jgi:hypothetical protein
MPVRLLTEDAKLYLIACDQEPLNKELAPLAAKAVTLPGTVASRDDMHLINKPEIVKQRAHREKL